MRLLIALLLLPVSAFSQTAFAPCAGMPSDAARLACFDAAADAAGLVAEAALGLSEPAGDTGDWTVRTDTNPLDDSTTVYLTLDAREGRSRYGRPITFWARCQSDETEVFVGWNDYLGFSRNGRQRVTVRIGDAAARTEGWSISTSNDATFAPGWAGDLLKEMLTADRLVLQTQPYNESPITAVFDTRGLDVALRPLAETCGWDY